jgi:hypothetical protein
MNEQEILNPACDDKEAFNACQRLGLRYQTGQWGGDAVKPADVASILCVLKNRKSDLFKNIPEKKFSSSTITTLVRETDPIESDTSQIQISPRENWMSVVTEKTECFAMSEKQSLRGKIVSVENRGKFCVIGVSSIDAQPLGTSRHLLIFHLTDSSNTRTKYFDHKRTIMTEWGVLPQLVRRDSAMIRMNLNPEHKISAWAVTMSGKRLNEVPVSYRNGAFEMLVNTDQPTGGCMTYELLVK